MWVCLVQYMWLNYIIVQCISILPSDLFAYIISGMAVPCIPKIQSMIEDAWNEGFDPQGASQLNNKLQGTKAWIGACEIYTLLTSLRVKYAPVNYSQHYCVHLQVIRIKFNMTKVSNCLRYIFMLIFQWERVCFDLQFQRIHSIMVGNSEGIVAECRLLSQCNGSQKAAP